MKRIQNSEIPDRIFRVIKPSKSDKDEDDETHSEDRSLGGQDNVGNYFKVLKIGN